MAAFDRVPRSQILLSVALSTIGVGLLWWTHSGPWRWATELQLHYMNAWSPQVNLLVVYGLLLALFLIPLSILHQKWQSPIQQHPDSHWWTHGPGRLFLLAAVLAAIGIYYIASGVFAGTLTDVSLAELPDSRASYVRVPTEGLRMERAIGIDDDWYAPVLREGRVAVVLSVRSPWEPGLADFQEGEGMRTPLGLPGVVLSTWQEQGLDVGPRVPVVSVDSDPYKNLFIGFFVGFFSIPALLVGLYQNRAQ